MKLGNEKLSIVWNLTRFCCWNCKFCCVNAELVRGFSQINSNRDEAFSMENELSYLEKIRILEQMRNCNYKLDFSGGEVLIDPLNIEVIKYASKILGKENIGVSTSGMFLTDDVIENIKDYINDVELTLDNVPFEYYELRSMGYHEFVSDVVKRLVDNDITVGIETVLTKKNINEKNIDKLFNWLVKHKVNKWSLLRFFPSGRGKNHVDLVPSHEEYCSVVDYIKKLAVNSDMEVHFQYLLPNHSGYTNCCRAVKKSIGILPNGVVTSCFWALNENMMPKDDKFYLGKLPEESLEMILNNKESLYWSKNELKCEIFEFEDKDIKNVKLLGYKC